MQLYLLLKKNKLNYEKQYIEFLVNNNQQYGDYMIENYNLLTLFIKDKSSSSQDILFSDTTNYFNEIHETIFFDSAHITDFGYKIFCEKISKEIKKMF